MEQEKPVSRQVQWQRKQIAAGKCAQCGKPRNLSPIRCDECLEVLAERSRSVNRHLTWKPGARGRIPLWYRKQQAEAANGRN